MPSSILEHQRLTMMYRIDKELVAIPSTRLDKSLREIEVMSTNLWTWDQHVTLSSFLTMSEQSRTGTL